MKYAKLINFKSHQLLMVCSANGITNLEKYVNQDLSQYNFESNVIDKYVTVLDNYFKGIKPNFDIFDIKATDFQIGVWKEISNVDFGQTVSYLDIAKKLNKPNASRAIGSALGKNPILILIPCHRAIRSNGSIGGFNTTISLKEDLIDFEKEYNKK